LSKDRVQVYGAKAIYSCNYRVTVTRRKELSQAFPQHRWKGVNPMGNEN